MTIIYKFTNNFNTTLATTIDNSITTIVLTSATGLPTIGANEVYSLTIADGTNIEEVTVTDDISSPSLIVTRNADGRGSHAFTAGSIIEMRPTSTQQGNFIQQVNGAQGSDITLTTDDVVSGDSITTATVDTDDKVLIQDTSDSNNVKTVTTQAIADLKTTIVGITGTKAQFDTAVSDGNILYVGDVTQYTDEMAQDAVGGMVDTTLVYTDGTPLLQRAALTGDVTANAGSNAITIATPSSTTVATDDKVLIKDTSDSDATKYVTAQSIRDLVPGNGTITSAQLATALTDETGTNKSVFSDNPALIQPTADNFINGYTSTATAAGTTTLTVASNQYQTFTGSTTQTCKLPVVSTLVLGTLYIITNLSSGVVTVQSSGSNTIQAMASNTTLIIQSNATSGTGASVWNIIAYYSAASDITGSGSMVRATSPTLVTPILGAASATSVTFSSTNGIIGTTTNNNATAGSVGELISSTVSLGSAVSLTTDTAKTVTSIPLTAGDWEVWGNVAYSPAATTAITEIVASISPTDNTQPTPPGNGAYTRLRATFGASSNSMAFFPGQLRVSVPSTTTYYLIAQASFTVDTLSAYGFIGARRRR